MGMTISPACPFTCRDGEGSRPLLFPLLCRCNDLPLHHSGTSLAHVTPVALWLSFGGGVVSYSLGVDLGTTFVAAATATATRVTMFKLGDRSVMIPATVYLREDGALVPGEAASLAAVSNPDR